METAPGNMGRRGDQRSEGGVKAEGTMGLWDDAMAERDKAAKFALAGGGRGA
jgi:hypothetical protein